VLLSSGDSFLHLIQKRRWELGFVTHLLNYPRNMPIAVRSVLNSSRVLRNFVLDYQLFVPHKTFKCNICALIYPNVVIVFYIIVYFWFLSSYMVLVQRKTIFTLACLNKLVILHTNELSYVNLVQLSGLWVVLLFRSGLFKLCRYCAFDFWISVVGKLGLLAFVMCCIVIYSFCFCSSESVNECMSVICKG
jgi:hypothetical protein